MIFYKSIVTPFYLYILAIKKNISGTGCSDPAERVASLSKHFNMLMVSYGAEAQDLSDREKYPYFFRTVPSVQHYM